MKNREQLRTGLEAAWNRDRKNLDKKYSLGNQRRNQDFNKLFTGKFDERRMTIVQ
jgi:hypothetical protein